MLKDADRMANSVDLDQSAPKSSLIGSTLSAQTCQSEKLRIIAVLDKDKI